MKALILSGGEGTRLRPFTYTRAKQLIPVANKPVLVHVIETLKNAGVTDIGVIVGGSTAVEIEETLGDGSTWDVSLTFIHQASPDGLAHAVKIAQDFLGDENFVMFLGDNVIQGGISTLIQDFDNNPWNSQIVLKEVADPRRYGVAKLHDNGSIEYLKEKPKNPPSNLALVGIYMFDKHIFEAVNSIEKSPRGELEITDAIQWLIDHDDYTVHSHVHEGWWIDTGKSESMLEANSYALAELTPTVAANVQISDDSEVDSRVSIDSGSIIENSIIRGPVAIGRDTVIRNSYIGPFTSIYHGVTIENCEIERSIILENSRISDLDTIIRDTLIGRNVQVKRNPRKPQGLKMNLGDNSTVWI